MFPGLRDNEHMHALIEKQLNGLLEIFWAFEAWDPTTKAYNDVRKTVERRLASVKNNRIYSDEPQDGLVCTVCGMREALHEGNIDEHHRIGQMRRIIEQTWRKRAAKYQEKSEESGSWIKNNERLCAVCLTKRVAREIFYEHHVFESFPSVVDFATENNPYYAIIMMDGDDMGKWINGDDGKLLDGFDKVDERYHKEFSRRLTVFSKEKVPTIVGDKSNENGPPKKGKLVYAGGDDVLAFMKLKDLLPTVKQLRSTFSSDEVLGKKATVSMGIVIAHKKEPLQLVIQTVQQMEAAAKRYRNERQEKDAVSIALLTHSGYKRMLTIPWYLDEKKEQSTIDLLQDLIDALGDNLSSTFLHHFNEAFQPLVHDGQKPPIERAMIESELRRLMKRAMKKKFDMEPLIEKLVQLYDLTNTFTEYIHLLETARFISLRLKEQEPIKEGLD